MANCTSKTQQGAAIKTAKLWDAEKISIGSSSSFDTQNGEQKTLTLTLEDLKGINKDYPKLNVTSLSAYTFIDNLTPEEYEHYDKVKIIIKNNSSIFEKVYRIDDLIEAREVFEKIDVFSKKIIRGNLEGFENLFDSQSFPDSAMIQIKDAVLSLNNSGGIPEKATVVRFDFDKLNKTHDSVVICYVELENKTSYSTYKLIFKGSNKKIIYFGINED